MTRADSDGRLSIGVIADDFTGASEDELAVALGIIGKICGWAHGRD